MAITSSILFKCDKMFTHPITNQAQCYFTSVIGRELVFVAWHGRCPTKCSDRHNRLIIFFFKEITEKCMHIAFVAGMSKMTNSLQCHRQEGCHCADGVAVHHSTHSTALYF